MVTSKKNDVQHGLNAEHLFNVMADCAPVLLWVSRADSSCIFFNKTWLEFTGRTVEQEWGLGWTEGIHFEDFQHCVDIYVDCFGRREPFEMEYRLRRYDGVYRWILDRGVPYYSEQGEFLGFIGSCIDISENKKAAELLKKMNEELEQRVQARTYALQKSEAALEASMLKAEEASRIKSEFVSTVSHELRTPMTAIKASLELILYANKGKNQQELEALLGIAHQNTNRMLRLINDILDVEKIAAGKLILHLQTQLLLPLIQHSMSSNSLFAEKYKVRLQLIESLPDAKARIDEDRFMQVLDNLLSNAVKFSKPNSTVTIAMRRQEGAIRIFVKDNGTGIPPEFESKIFSQFMQAQQPCGSRIGSGLGLNIAKSIMEQHHGSIGFESAASGCTFFISLPEIGVHDHSV